MGIEASDALDMLNMRIEAANGSVEALTAPSVALLRNRAPSRRDVQRFFAEDGAFMAVMNANADLMSALSVFFKSMERQTSCMAGN